MNRLCSLVDDDNMKPDVESNCAAQNTKVKSLNFQLENLTNFCLFIAWRTGLTSATNAMNKCNPNPKTIRLTSSMP